VSKKKSKQLSSREQRQLRTRQILFTAIAILVIATFVLSLLHY
jgi:predicted nucleic acid-binding Zn ribbon protein